MHVRAVVFDLDGTLLNSLADIANAGNTILRQHGLPTHPIDAYRWFVGDGVRRLVERIVPVARRSDAASLQQWVWEFLEQYHRAWNVESRLYDGVPELLAGLAERQLPLAVLSNKPQEATARCVDYYLAACQFVTVLGQQADRPPKPDLTGVLQIVDRLGVPAASCLYLGDTAVDMQTALGAGLIPVGAAWGFRDGDELRAAGAQAVIDHPLELLVLIDGSAPPAP